MKTTHPSKSKWTLAATALSLLAMTATRASAATNSWNTAASTYPFG